MPIVFLGLTALTVEAAAMAGGPLSPTNRVPEPGPNGH